MTTSGEHMERIKYEAEQAQARLKEQGQQAAYTTRETAYQAGQGAENVKHGVASGLHSAAGMMRQQAMERGQPGLAGRVAEPLDRSAKYLDEHTLPQIREDASDYAREHPIVTAAGLFTAAFLVGRLLRRR